MKKSPTNAENLITDNLDIWTSAIKKRGSQGRGSSKKIDLYGINKLRELILELAVRGLLVPQDPNDEPASVLLNKIAAEKEQLIKDKKIKKQKPLPPISDEVEPFELPQGWEWAKFDDIGYTNIGLTYKPINVSENGIPVLRSSNVQMNKICLVDLVRVSGVEPKESAYVKIGDLLICARNGSKALVGKSAYISDLSEPMVFGAFMAIFRSRINLYLHMFLSSPLFRGQLEGVNTTTINQITQSNLRSTLAPIPPETEQPRIVAKVDELMALCDQLEEQTENSLHAHKTLVESLLDALTQAPDNTAFTSAWERIAQHFDILFTTEHSIDLLKQTILQLAVMGKLVPQDPNDEPASVLLEKIAAEKAQLMKDKKIKKQKPLPPISEDEKPFDLPKGWEWVRFFDVNTVKSELVPSVNFPDANQIAPDSINKNSGTLIEHRTVKIAGTKGPNSKFYKDQILYSKIRPSLNKVVIAPYNGLCSADMYPINCYSNSMFMLKYMLSEPFLTQVRLAENRVKMPKLNLESLGIFLTVIPPEAEQSRIVTKINELMNLCEILKTRIYASQTTQLHLADAMTEQVLN